MAYIPFAQETDAKYTLTDAFGNSACFNDQTDPNYVGQVAEVTGLDGAEIRESADDLVESDGGKHGNFYYSRRPITFTVLVYNHGSMYVRAQRIDKLSTVLGNALRSNIGLFIRPTWYASQPYVTVWTEVRQNQPLRVTGGWNKSLSVNLISEYAPLFNASTTVASTPSGTPVTTENRGNYPSRPIIRVTGPTTNPVVTNTTTGQVLNFTSGYSLTAGQYVDVDVLNHTAVRDNASAQSRYINFLTTTWPTVRKGNNTFTLSGGGTLTVTYRDSWS